MRDAATAVRNGLQLGTGLIVTWGVALGVRLFLPRYLGPAAFGSLSFAEAFATAFFVLLVLGVDTYIRTEIPLRPSHGDDFFGGILAVRLALTGALVAAMWIILTASHRPLQVRLLVLIFAAQQGLFGLNETLAAFLHARGRVSGLAGVNIGAKFLWAAGIVVAVLAGFGLVGIAGAYVLAESLKGILLFGLCRRHLALRLRFDLPATFAVVLASAPFYLSYVARNVYSRIDVSLLAFTATDVEVGWYGAANNLANITLLVTPVFIWVLLPLFARAASRSDEELTRTIHRTLQFVQAVAMPVALMLALGADEWVRLVFGAAYAPAAISLRILAPLSVLTYVAAVGSQWLVVLQRSWRVTGIAVLCMLVNPALVLGFIDPSLRYFGAGGGGAGCALAQFATELLVTTLLLANVGARIADRRTFAVFYRSIAACIAVALLDHAISDMGVARLAVDFAAYVGLVLALRAVRVGDAADLIRLALQRHEAVS